MRSTLAFLVVTALTFPARAAPPPQDCLVPYDALSLVGLAPNRLDDERLAVERLLERPGWQVESDSTAGPFALDDGSVLALALRCKSGIYSRPLPCAIDVAHLSTNAEGPWSLSATVDIAVAVAAHELPIAAAIQFDAPVVMDFDLDGAADALLTWHTVGPAKPATGVQHRTWRAIVRLPKLAGKPTVEDRPTKLRITWGPEPMEAGGDGDHERCLAELGFGDSGCDGVVEMRVHRECQPSTCSQEPRHRSCGKKVTVTDRVLVTDRAGAWRPSRR